MTLSNTHVVIKNVGNMHNIIGVFVIVSLRALRQASFLVEQFDETPRKRSESLAHFLGSEQNVGYFEAWLLPELLADIPQLPIDSVRQIMNIFVDNVPMVEEVDFGDEQFVYCTLFLDFVFG